MRGFYLDKYNKVLKEILSRPCYYRMLVLLRLLDLVLLLQLIMYNWVCLFSEV